MTAVLGAEPRARRRADPGGRGIRIGAPVDPRHRPVVLHVARRRLRGRRRGAGPAAVLSAGLLLVPLLVISLASGWLTRSVTDPTARIGLVVPSSPGSVEPAPGPAPAASPAPASSGAVDASAAGDGGQKAVAAARNRPVTVAPAVVTRAAPGSAAVAPAPALTAGPPEVAGPPLPAPMPPPGGAAGPVPGPAPVAGPTPGPDPGGTRPAPPHRPPPGSGSSGHKGTKGNGNGNGDHHGKGHDRDQRNGRDKDQDDDRHHRDGGSAPGNHKDDRDGDGAPAAPHTISGR